MRGTQVVAARPIVVAVVETDWHTTQERGHQIQNIQHHIAQQRLADRVGDRGSVSTDPRMRGGNVQSGLDFCLVEIFVEGSRHGRERVCGLPNVVQKRISRFAVDVVAHVIASVESQIPFLLGDSHSTIAQLEVSTRFLFIIDQAETSGQRWHRGELLQRVQQTIPDHQTFQREIALASIDSLLNVSSHVGDVLASVAFAGDIQRVVCIFRMQLIERLHSFIELFRHLQFTFGVPIRVAVAVPSSNRLVPNQKVRLGVPAMLMVAEG
mmetsp:Transcript_29315/g.57521  ORF Transcript_29315/g.57521 Transcript_29315/m.57521 type:complete len:267 (+) Transcript_29315:450-1250(+)